MFCDRCGTGIIGALVGDDAKTYCNMCYDILFPPMLVLTKIWDDASLFHPGYKKYVCRDLHNLEKCGFMLFKHRIYNKKEISPKYREFLVFRYFGKLVCPLLTNHKWGVMKQTCGIKHCI